MFHDEARYMGADPWLPSVKQEGKAYYNNQNEGEPTKVSLFTRYTAPGAWLKLINNAELA